MSSSRNIAGGPRWTAPGASASGRVPSGAPGNCSGCAPIWRLKNGAGTSRRACASWSRRKASPRLSSPRPAWNASASPLRSGMIEFEGNFEFLASHRSGRDRLLSGHRPGCDRACRGTRRGCAERMSLLAAHQSPAHLHRHPARNASSSSASFPGIARSRLACAPPCDGSRLGLRAILFGPEEEAPRSGEAEGDASAPETIARGSVFAQLELRPEMPLGADAEIKP